ncbi:hypothetical protein V8E53_012681 [Lactarius tabidus]
MAEQLELELALELQAFLPQSELSRSPVFTIYTAAGVVVFLGINTHDVVLTSQGVPESFSSYLVSIANAGNTVGRLVSGILTNHHSTSCSHPRPSYPYRSALVTIAVTCGTSSSAMMALGDCADVGRRTGMHLTIVSIGVLAGPPISGAINHSTVGSLGSGSSLRRLRDSDL